MEIRQRRRWLQRLSPIADDVRSRPRYYRLRKHIFIRLYTFVVDKPDGHQTSD